MSSWMNVLSSSIDDLADSSREAIQKLGGKFTGSINFDTKKEVME